MSAIILEEMIRAALQSRMTRAFFTTAKDINEIELLTAKCMLKMTSMVE